MEYLAENLIYGIECSMSKFTKTEEELAKYILQHPEEVSQLTISQIAKKLHISAATITRFCQKLAFSVFNEFKHELKRFVDLQNTPIHMKDLKMSIILRNYVKITWASSIIPFILLLMKISIKRYLCLPRQKRYMSME
ncbi:MurR/RpiR family transcriptional regulator [Peribacillus muralis]|uniref:MurR/RpiR family transcriptional regulator n=1 Tax=Peribacillus muralis TaxID=264697 RepID=UPI001F2BA339|nr:hypothetical protein [Peribacillus muralis]